MGEFLNTFQNLHSTGKILGLLGQNQTAIANNISNCQTPNYVRKNTNFAEVIGSMRSPIETPLAKKMGPSPMMMEDKGKVVLEQELTNMQRNFLLYNLVTRRATSLVTTIKNSATLGR